ncbi:Leucine-rich repeat protein kinase family protein [Perilla frutescens var. hirtella]|uniref:Leucine-rich repeat protein kinase family protein n=1 Tax=Perilla frutescens var. hirtella TaxID=608512 RepID=A0AAD4IMP6_PERFH|nr:Leucine-rich repeat protein kinase family protein [Perilla frutescens var. hirtella]
MSAVYDNWERLVAAVMKKQQLWELFHQQSRSPSILSDASDFSSSFRDLDFDFSSSSHGSSSRSQKPPPKLVLISNFWPAFDVKEVTMASAKFLGRGTFGSTYVATMDDGQRFVVKRLMKSKAISEMDFKRNMEIVGDVKHDNVVALRAYYSSPDDEKLMFYDYYSNGSMYSLLHGDNRADVDWETRLKIAIGAARGIAVIHTKLGGKLVHGNIKASNIFLDSQSYGCVSDFGLTNTAETLFMPSAKWNAPKVENTENVSHASDVYSFGILLLELLTRKPTARVPGGPVAVDLVKLVGSVKSKERAVKVFDPDLLKHPSISKQMMKMLQIGMTCVAKPEKKRPKIFEVVKMLEDIVILIPVTPSLDSTRQEGKLVFLDDVNPIYDLEQVLRASAKVLGRGTFGSCFKAELDNGDIVVHKLRGVRATFKEFQQHIEVSRRINHINVGRLKGYYYGRDMKLLLYDYYNQGSLFVSLEYGRVHGTSLEWRSRVKIALGAARGIAHIHGQHGRKLVLGIIESSNIFLNGQNDSIITFDSGLAKLMKPVSLSPDSCAPEVANSRKVSQASDVYSFGVVLLEIVSGRPFFYSGDYGSAASLAEWVRSVHRSEWTARVLDVECVRYGHEQEMIQLLQIAVGCISIVPKHRPTIFEVVKLLEEICGVEPETILEESSVQTGLEYLLEDLLTLLSIEEE